MKTANSTVVRKIQIASLGLAIIAMPYSIKVCHIGVIAFLLTWLLEGDWSSKFQRLRSNKLLHFYFGFIVLLFLGMLSTENKTEGWLKLESVIFFFLLPFTLGTTQSKYSNNEISLFLKIFIVTCCIATFICLGYASYTVLTEGQNNTPDYLNYSTFQSVNPQHSGSWSYFSYMSLAAGIKMNPIYLSLYLVFCILILLNQHVFNGEKNFFPGIVQTILIVYFSIFVIFLSSRLMILSLLLLYLVLLFYYLADTPRRKKSIGVIVLLLFGGLTISINPVSHYKNWQELKVSEYEVQENKLYQTSTEIRISLLWASWNCLLEVNPITGTGIGDVETVVSKMASEHGITNIHNNFNPHNQYITLALGLGIPGLLIFVALLGVPLTLSWQAKDYLLFGFICLFALMCITEPALERQKSVILFSIFFPLLAFHRKSFFDYTLILKTLGAKN